jgi:hypothetical protein
MQQFFDVVQTRSGAAIADVKVTVYNSSGGAATLYSDNGVTPKANPVTTNADGEYSFYAANGTYSAAFSSSAYVNETRTGIQLFDPADSAASNQVAYTPAGANAVVTTVQTKLRESVSVKDFGAVGDGVANDTTAIQAALTYANSLSGTTIFVPEGTYKCTSSLNIYAGTTLEGEGKTNSILSFNNTGDGIKSTFAINSSSAANINLNNLRIINTNASNIGGGYVDVGGTFVNVFNCYFTGWKYGIIFDQTEIASIDLCEFISSYVGVWLVNGADHTVSALPFFTNRITISRNGFNSAPACIASILDDGGSAHSIVNNNFNAGLIGIRAACVTGLLISGNEGEVQLDCDIYLTDTTYAGQYYNPVSGFEISANLLISGSGGRNIAIKNASNGSIVNNFFGQATAAIAFINGSANYSTGVVIEANNKLLSFVSPAVLPVDFVTGFGTILTHQIIRQVPVTYVVNSLSAGTVTVTPATMEFIYPGSKFMAMNNNNTAVEFITVTSTTSTTFTATFASNKAANFVLYGTTQADQVQGVWTPVLFGNTTAGTNTYSVQKGSYFRIGNLVTVSGEITVSAKDAAMAGNLFISGLPYFPITANSYTYAIAFTGFTLSTGLTNIVASTNGTKSLQLLAFGSGAVANLIPATSIASTTCAISFSGQYLTSDY